jgi:hypothetical protein
MDTKIVNNSKILNSTGDFCQVIRKQLRYTNQEGRWRLCKKTLQGLFRRYKKTAEFLFSLITETPNTFSGIPESVFKR